MDYYNLTVFEWITDQLGAQGTVCGGGRYDGLFEQLGGKPTPAVGWGMGVERMLLLLEARRRRDAGAGRPTSTRSCPARPALPVAMATCEALRAAGVSGADARRRRRRLGSMKAQFKRADASGARYALVFGADELARGEVARQAAARRRRAPQRTLRARPTSADWAADLRNA